MQRRRQVAAAGGGGTNGVKGAHGESGSASPRVWAQRQSPWSAGQGRTFAMAG